MKTSLLLDRTPHHDDVMGSGGIAPRILNLDCRLMCVVIISPRPLYIRGKSPGTFWLGVWMGHRAGLWTRWWRKNLINAPAGNL